ncbi:MAG: hypothetical protein ACM3JB_25065 [Acidobacteriaceae bacterium]
MHRRIVLSIALILVCAAMLWAAKDFQMPRAENAKTYPAHDEHPKERVTIAADPYDMPDKESIFTVKYNDHDLLPVYVIVTNDGDEPVTLTDIDVTMKYRDRSKVAPATEDNILSRITRIKQRGGEIPRSYPIPLPKKSKGGIPKGALDELDQAMFKVKAVEPRATRAGFMFFDVSGLENPLAGATLYITGVRDNNGHDLMYFEIPMEKYLSAQPSH